ncbi:MAG: TorF family putative porin [Rudaea sp.]
MLALIFAGSAHAQIAAEISIASDNDFRGNSLSDGDPVATFSLTADGRAGWFGGVLVSQAHFNHYHYDRSGPQFVSDAGYAGTIAGGWSWEAGATSTLFPNSSIYDYHEFFAGLAKQAWSTRIYLSPNYYGRGFRSQYAEFNYTRPLGARWHLLAHIGVQHSDVPMAEASKTTFDTRLGVAVQWQRIDMQLSWVNTNRISYLEPVVADSDRHTLILRVSCPL